MKILHLYKDYFPVEGGIENHIKQLAEAQAARGHQVSVLITSRDRHTHVETINGVRVIFAARLATISSTPISAAMFALLRREQPDIVHLQFPYPWGEIANYF
ncbi:MAG TPA: glycosyltransferase, partial [Anaerolineae bacterium]